MITSEKIAPAQSLLYKLQAQKMLGVESAESFVKSLSRAELNILEEASSGGFLFVRKMGAEMLGECADKGAIPEIYQIFKDNATMSQAVAKYSVMKESEIIASNYEYQNFRSSISSGKLASEEVVTEAEVIADLDQYKAALQLMDGK